MKAVEHLLDTSVIVRYLIADAPTFAKRAKRIIESNEVIGVSADCIAETGYVLTKHYGVDRDAAVGAMRNLLNRHNLVTVDLDKSVAARALNFCKGSNRVSFDDAMIWATARSFGVPNIYTFDARFPDQDVTLLSRPAK